MRTLVSILTVLPLLMPPGMCVCQFVKPGTPPAGTGGDRGARLVPAPQHDGEQAKCHSCPCHSKTSAVAARPGTVPGSGRPKPNDPAHEPGCPALKTVDHSKVAEQNHPVIDPVVPASGGVGSRIGAPPAALPRLPEPAAVSSPPAYITFRALLI